MKAAIFVALIAAIVAIVSYIKEPSTLSADYFQRLHGK